MAVSGGAATGSSWSVWGSRSRFVGSSSRFVCCPGCAGGEADGAGGDGWRGPDGGRRTVLSLSDLRQNVATNFCGGRSTTLSLWGAGLVHRTSASAHDRQYVGRGPHDRRLVVEVHNILTFWIDGFVSLWKKRNLLPRESETCVVHFVLVVFFAIMTMGRRSVGV